MNRQGLAQIVRGWRWQLVLRDALFALAVANLFLALVFWRATLFRWPLPLLAFAATLAVRLVASRPWRLDLAQLCRHLDRTNPLLEESSTLFLHLPGQLTLLERLQLQRINRALSAGSPSARASFGAPPRNFLSAASLCLSATALLVAGIGFLTHPGILAHPVALDQTNSHSLPSPTRSSAPALPTIIGNFFTIAPPAYTGHPPRRINGFTVEVEEGSAVSWDITLDRPVRAARLVAGAVTVPLTSTTDHHLQGKRLLSDSALFFLAATLPDGTAWNPPELFSLKIIKDQPPVVRLLQPALTRTEVNPPATAPILVEVTVSDDYAVAEAHLVATVAKGSGEAVKFREQTLPFDSNTADPATPLVRRFTKALDLTALGLEPGDELYFFIEAHDNRQPAANRTRSETRFVTLRGPEEKKTTTGRGVAGVNLIPAYFRSERQLIIDTEKLLADHPTLPNAEYRSRSNDLGADQGFLRGRYGRFLGEDQEESALTDHLETNADPLQARAPAPAAGPHAAASIAQRFEQEHIEQDREGGGDDAAPSRPPPSGGPLAPDQIRQPFVDSHDEGEKPGFFDHETKGTMQDALGAMWEAEGFLRTVRPQEALAPEHRALEILKDLQQSTRAYVQHVGFDAPPIKVAQRRLQGDAADVPPRTNVPNSLPPADPAVPSIRAALAAMSRSAPVPASVWQEIEPALTAVATRQPDDFLPGLQALRRLRANGSAAASDLPIVQRALLRLLPSAPALPERAVDPAPTLAAPYFQALQTGASPQG